MKTAHTPAGQPLYVEDCESGYPSIRRYFTAGERLEFDESYRLAHLPLVAPDSPLVIANGRADYEMGRYGTTRFSLVLPVPFDVLESAPSFQTFEHLLRESRIEAKINWPLQTRRQHMLHATLCISLQDVEVPMIVDKANHFLDRNGPFRIRLGGPINGAKNTGRIYYTAYPEKRNGLNQFHMLLDALGKPRTDLYLIGYYNLFEPLDEMQTTELAAALQAAAAEPMMETTVKGLWVMATNDDLCLSGRIAHEMTGTRGLL